MADIIYYFNGALSSDWSDLDNWWMDSEYTTPAENLPSSEDTVFIYATVNNNSGEPISVLSISIYDCLLIVPVTVSEGLFANEESGLLSTINGDVVLNNNSYNNGTIYGDATLNNYSYNDAAGTIEGNATFNDSSYNGGIIIGDNTIVIFNGASQNFATINYPTTFNNNSINSDEGGVINNTATFNNSSQNAGYAGSAGYNTYFNNYSHNSGTVSENAIFSDSSTNSGYISGDAIVIYPYSAPLVNTGEVNGYIFYSNYPTLYYNNATADSNWHNRLNWWIDSGYTQRANEVPGSSQDVVINGSIQNTASDMYCNNATINSDFFAQGQYTLNVTSNITVSDTYYIANSMYMGPNIICTNAVFNGNSYITANNSITAYGTVTFSNTSKLGNSVSGGANITGDVVFNDSSEFVSGTINGNASFYGTSVFSGGTVTLGVTVYSPHPLPFTYGGTINGSLLYSGYSPRTVYFYHTNSSEDWGGNFWYTESTGGGSSTYPPNPAVSKDNVVIENSVGSNTGNLDATVASLTVNNTQPYVSFISIDITCDSANFNDSSYLTGSATLTQSQYHNGNITFSDLSNNQGTVNPEVTVIFQDSSYNDGTINGDVDVYYPSENPIGGTVTGFITYYGYGALYFGMTTDGDWSNPNNWYFDAANTLPVNDVPPDIIPYRSVIIQSNVTSSPSISAAAYDLNTYGSYPYIDNVNITVSNLATFSEETFLGPGATITGNALFENLATNRGGTITGTGTFTLSSAEEMISNGYDGTYGDIEFQYGKGVNGSSILGLV
jgi:hypothetical protein